MNPDDMILFDSCTGELEPLDCEEFEWDDFDGDLEELEDIPTHVHDTSDLLSFAEVEDCEPI